MYCPWCGKVNQDDGNYCINCGKKLIFSPRSKINKPTKSPAYYLIPLLFSVASLGSFLETFGVLKIMSIDIFTTTMNDGNAIKLIVSGFLNYFVFIAIGFILIVIVRPRIEKRIPPSHNKLFSLTLLLSVLLGVGLGFVFAFP
jgi:DNA-directed RNA polymerase subunit RPC12/RpoP